MSVIQNIEFLREQRKTFRLVLANMERMAEGRKLQIQSTTEEAKKLRGRIRALRQTLVSDGRLPSIAAIRERIDIEYQIQKTDKVVDSVFAQIDKFGELAQRWLSNLKELEGLPSDDTTRADKDKLRIWTEHLREQLDLYGFGSLPTSQILISNDTYKPEHGGFDLQVDLFKDVKEESEKGVDLQTGISASDMIRTIWAYLYGMLEISRVKDTNHHGLLILDEPRQQSTRTLSFQSFLKRASESSSYGQQVILFTSEDRTRLNASLKDI